VEGRGILDQHALEAEVEELLHGELAALLLHGDDDAVERVFVGGDALDGFDPDLFADLGRVRDLAPVDDLHAEIGPGADDVDHGTGVVAGAEDVNALAESFERDDPIVGAAPEDENRREQREAERVDVAGADGELGEEVEESGEGEAVEAEDEQDAEVDGLACGDELRLEEIEVVGEVETDDGEAGDLEVAVLVVQGKPAVLAEDEKRRGHEAACYDYRFTQQQHDGACGVIHIEQTNH
jgi:hypothetical protein